MRALPDVRCAKFSFPTRVLSSLGEKLAARPQGGSRLVKARGANGERVLLWTCLTSKVHDTPQLSINGWNSQEAPLVVCLGLGLARIHRGICLD